MSRGLGKTQRAILECLKTDEWMSMDDLTRSNAKGLEEWNYTENWDRPGGHYMAIYRAIKSLERRGLVEVQQRRRTDKHPQLVKAIKKNHDVPKKDRKVPSTTKRPRSGKKRIELKLEQLGIKTILKF